jgi:hypothetical protein
MKIPGTGTTYSGGIASGGINILRNRDPHNHQSFTFTGGDVAVLYLLPDAYLRTVIAYDV